MADDEAPYKQSRAALRRIYGSRRIDAGNHQSAADTTPSGLARRQGAPFDDTPSGRDRVQRERGDTEGQIAAQHELDWRTQFPLQDEPVAPVSQVRPLSVLTRRASPSPLQAIGDAYKMGAVSGTFDVPQFGGSVGFSTPMAAAPPKSIAPDMPEDITSMLDLIGSTPFANSSGLGYSAIARRNRKSVMDSASRWITPI